MKKKLIVALVDVVAENVINLMVEDNALTLQRNMEFVIKQFENSPIRYQDIMVKVIGLMDPKTGLVELPDDDAIEICLADYVRKDDETNGREDTAC